MHASLKQNATARPQIDSHDRNKLPEIITGRALESESSIPATVASHQASLGSQSGLARLSIRPRSDLNQASLRSLSGLARLSRKSPSKLKPVIWLDHIGSILGTSLAPPNIGSILGRGSSRLKLDLRLVISKMSPFSSRFATLVQDHSMAKGTAPSYGIRSPSGHTPTYVLSSVIVQRRGSSDAAKTLEPPSGILS